MRATVARVSDWLDQVPDSRSTRDDHGDELRPRLATLCIEYRLVLLLRGPLGVSWETTAFVLGRSVHAAQCVQYRARSVLMADVVSGDERAPDGKIRS